MRRILTIVLLLSCCAITMMAQPRLRHKEYYLGIHGGVTASTVQFSPKIKNMTPLTETAMLGYNGGLVFRYSGHKCCGLQVEVNYMTRGWREVNKESSIDYGRQLSYIEVPFLTHIYFGNKARGFINLGPQVGYLILDKVSGNPNPEYTHQYEPITNKIDWGIAGGVGFYYRTPKAGTYEMEVRFNYSLGSIYGTRTTDFFSQANPMDLSVNIAYMWDFKQKKKTTNKTNNRHEDKL